MPGDPPRGAHWATAKIQRAWRIHCWRRRFLAFGRGHLKWVGSLDWLQRHNRLYGTELAEEEDQEGYFFVFLGARRSYLVSRWETAYISSQEIVGEDLK